MFKPLLNQFKFRLNMSHRKVIDLPARIAMFTECSADVYLANAGRFADFSFRFCRVACRMGKYPTLVWC